VASNDKVRSLVDENGYFHHDWTATTRIDPKEVELELRAQIDRAYAMGVRPTHLDSHQYRLYENGKDLSKSFSGLLTITSCQSSSRVTGSRTTPIWNPA